MALCKLTGTHSVPRVMYDVRGTGVDVVRCSTKEAPLFLQLRQKRTSLIQ